MTKYNEKRIVSHTPNQMYELVAGVENYPEFLPWCIASRIIEKNDTIMVADLIVGFQVFREKFSILRPICQIFRYFFFDMFCESKIERRFFLD